MLSGLDAAGPRRDLHIAVFDLPPGLTVPPGPLREITAVEQDHGIRGRLAGALLRAERARSDDPRLRPRAIVHLEPRDGDNRRVVISQVLLRTRFHHGLLLYDLCGPSGAPLLRPQAAPSTPVNRDQFSALTYLIAHGLVSSLRRQRDISRQTRLPSQRGNPLSAAQHSAEGPWSHRTARCSVGRAPHALSAGVHFRRRANRPPRACLSPRNPV